MSDRIARVTIDNPPMNLGDHALLSDLARFSTEVRTDDTVGVIVFDSADPDYFYAHVDMADTTVLEQLLQDGALNFIEELHESYRTLPQLTIAKIAGRTRGGGIEFISALDLRYAALDTALFSQNEVSLGIFPGGGGSQYLPRLLGRSRALEVIIGADAFDAALAERYGLINRALPADELDGFVERLTQRIASFPPEAVSVAKQAVDSGIVLSVRDGLQEENKLLRQIVNPQVAALLHAALEAGAQTRQGELDMESLIDGLLRSQPPRG
ncbi:enoyl-CoA hydratase/isomerase family protein [Streptomyces sp. NPDC002680]|uniref:enoyl-CoA hydratase/isomerase family protein n=1 Tax=Streptomyces sp. NPDC002680 TaxID=3364659 RepID=UPI0036B079B4